jgi:predicted NBD/HSP70 family sugar kinase
MKNLINNLTRALRDVIAIVDPATIIMGGGMGSQEEICQELRMNLQNQINQKIDIRSTTLTSRAGVVGAMSVALNGIRNMAVNSSSHIDFGVTS